MTDDKVDDVTFSIESQSGETAQVTVPAAIVDEIGGETNRAETVADIVLQTVVGEAHHMVHHGHGETGAGLEAAEQRALELFEERYGMTYAEATGHDH